MSHIETKKAVVQANILSSSIGLTTKTITISATGVTADAYGNKIVPAGTIIPSNDAEAKGILVEDVEVTAGDHEGAIIIAGRVYADRLPVEVDSAAKTVLEASGIHFDALPETTR